MTASDASEYGGGLCYSVGLTGEGRAAAALIQAEMDAPPLPSEIGVKGFMGISYCDGIGGLRQPAERCGVQMLLFISIDNDSS